MFKKRSAAQKAAKEPATHPMDDDDFQAAPRKPGGLLAGASQKKREKKDGSSSSRVPKPTSSHVQKIGGAGAPPAPSAAVGATSSRGKQAASPIDLSRLSPVAGTPPARQAPGSGPSHQPLAPVALNAAPPASAAPTPTKAAAKRKTPVAATPTDDADDGAPPKPKAARTPKAATPRATPSKSASPGAAIGASGSRVKEADVAELVEAFLLSRNKPLNGQMLSDGLLGDGHKASKPAVEKALQALVDAGTVSVGEWGKSKLWWPNQQLLSAAADPATDGKIAALQARIPALKAAGLATARELAERGRMLSLKQLEEQLAAEEAACKALETRIAAKEVASKAGAAKAFTPAEAKKVRSSYEKLQKEWGRRKLMLRERLAEYAEGTNKKVAALVEELGIELDEDVGVDPAQFGVKVKWTR